MRFAGKDKSKPAVFWKNVEICQKKCRGIPTLGGIHYEKDIYNSGYIIIWLHT